MKNILLLVILISFQNPFLYSQDIQRARKTIDTLASKSMHGRGYVLGGDSIAARYIKDQFKSIGIAPIKNSYYQYFKFDVNTFPKKVVLKADKKNLVVGQDYIVNPISGKGKCKVEVQLLDTMIFTDAKARQNLLSTNLKS